MNSLAPLLPSPKVCIFSILLCTFSKLFFFNLQDAPSLLLLHLTPFLLLLLNPPLSRQALLKLSPLDKRKDLP